MTTFLPGPFIHGCLQSALESWGADPGGAAAAVGLSLPTTRLDPSPSYLHYVMLAGAAGDVLVGESWG